MPLPQNYSPKEFEDKIYKQWQDNRVGSPEVQKSVQQLEGSVKTHTILMPPPNLTGNMHAGHSFQHFLMDTLSRVNRQKGKLNLWYPGVDHAGIQLEGVIDKLIKRGEFDEEIKSYLGDNKVEINIEIDEDVLKFLESKNRDDLPKLIKQNFPEMWTKLAWSKVNLWRDNQKKQSSILGDTPDYSRTLFTLDDRATKMVMAAFEQYHKDGLIYKGSYLINWSVGLQTAVSDMAGEIEFLERKDPFVTFEYEVKEFKIKNPKLATPHFQTFLHEFLLPLNLWPRLQLSTVRPETKFTDLAVAMHPSKLEIYFNENLFAKEKPGFDKVLAKEFIDNVKDYGIEIFYHLPTLHNGVLKLIFSEKVDPNFGTGILKITPVHDQFDYDLYQEFVQKGILEGGKAEAAIGRDGKLTEVCGEKFSGLTVEQGRLAVIKRLAETGYISVKKDFASEATQILSEIKTNLESESFKATDYSYEEGMKRLKEIMGEVGTKLAIDWDYIHNVSICERSKTVIEPLISEEFFLSYENEFEHKEGLKNSEKLNNDNEKSGAKTNLKQLGLEGVNETKYFSEDYKARAVNFLNNIKNWCISRDLVWGHKIPVWYNLDLNPDKKFYSYQEIQNNPELDRHFQISQFMPEKYGNWIQEEKILDTWFSSCLWPLTTLNFYDYWKGQKVVIIHGSPDTKRDYKISSRHWFPWLKTELENKGAQVFTPEMPNSEKPDYEEWKKTLESLPMEIDDQTILVGHSAGGAFLVRYLNEKQLAIKQLVLVSASSTIQGETSRLHQLSNFEVDSSIQKLKIPTVVITSKDEPEYRHKNAEEYAKIFRTNVTYFENYGHFIQQDMGKTEFPELLDLLLINNDFQTYYSTQEMITGGDIFYIWIVRMIVLGKYFTGKIPFEKVVINPTILDEKGRKMSKSLGNGLDPVEAIDKFSSDSLRLGMLSGMIPGRNMKMGGKIADNLMEKYRNFGNKLWNVARFLESQDATERI